VTVYTIEAHGRRYDIEASGIIERCAQQGNPYEPQLLEQIYERRKPGTVAVDAGAHIGNHTLWMVAICGLRVVAFEPSEEAFDILRRNVREHNNTLEEALILRNALGSDFGRARLVGDAQYVEEPWRSMMNQLKPGDGSVGVNPLDSYELDNVSVIKADVEGMEADVIRGAYSTIRRCQPDVYAEVWNNEKSAALEDALSAVGYRFDRTIKTATPVQRWVPA
jgi:FkbM family methyltransferase